MTATLRYQMAAKGFILGLGLIRWACRFSPHFDKELGRLMKFYDVVGRIDDFNPAPPEVQQ